jgi:hypothetical protein
MHRTVFGAPVTVGDPPDGVAEPAVDLPWLQATRSEALLRVRGVGRFHVRHGREVVVAPVTGVPAAQLDVWLDGTVSALVLVQRRTFALHASTVRLDGRLVAVAGPRGAGKSTTVCLLAARGHPVVTDDVTAITPDGGRLGVVPSGRRLRLWPDAATRLGYDLDAGVPVAAGLDKRSFAIADSTGGHELGLVVTLRTRPRLDTPVVRTLHGAAAVEALAADTYRPVLSRLHPDSHLRWLAAIAAAAPVVRIDRPAHGWSGEDVAAAIERAARA